MNDTELMTLLIAPRVSEKSTRVGDAHRQFVFRVLPKARKPDIKRAVELMFKVEVEAVRVANVRGKVKSGRMGRGGRRPDWKKAYVTLKPGFDINFQGAQ
ncbi:MAG: 50S ribosomal protein L23 [Gammaproteobacteria bacterium]